MTFNMTSKFSIEALSNIPRFLVVPALSFLVVLASSQVLSAAETVRIETRPFYGATITIEEGVRVFRPLPADRRVIINPQGRTPLSLNFDDSRNVTHHFDDGRDSLNEHFSN